MSLLSYCFHYLLSHFSSGFVRRPQKFDNMWEILSIFLAFLESLNFNIGSHNKIKVHIFCDFSYRILLKGVIEKVVRYHNGAWQKVNFVVLADKSLQRVENVFECVVKLPQTAYTVRRTMLYTPSKCITMNTMGWYPTIVAFFLHLHSPTSCS